MRLPVPKPPPANGPPVRRATPHVSVLFEDDTLLVVDKPPGLTTVPGRASAESLITHLRATGRPGAEDLRLVHRLDKDTSGVLVVAKTLDAQRTLTEQFAAATVRKTYLALIAGRPDTDAGTISAPLYARSDGSGLVRVDSRRGKPAITHWVIAETFRGFALLTCRPRTGRTHQIRVHLAHAHIPLAVDPDYGGDHTVKLSDFKPGYRASRRHPERPLLARLSLHAESIFFRHPTTDDEVTFRVDPPKDFAVTLKQLRKYAS